MKITPKPPEILLAQAADYAETLPHEEQSALMQEIGTHAINGTAETADAPEGLAGHLREVGGCRNKAIEMRGQALQAYEKFEPLIQKLLTNITRTENLENTEGFVGRGSNVAAYSIELDDKQYIAKVLFASDDIARHVDFDIPAMALGVGIPHLEQLSAVSYKDGVVVTERIPGKDFSQLPVEDTAHITESQLIEALGTMDAALDAGIAFDCSKSSNYMYDPDEGFGFIDYADVAGSHLTRVEDPRVEVAEEFMTMLCHIDHNTYGIQCNSKEDYQYKAGVLEAKLSLLIRYRSALSEHAQRSDSDYSKVFKQIDERVQKDQEFIDNCAQPGWIERDIADMEQERQRLRAAEAQIIQKQQELIVIGVNPDIF